MRKIFSFLIFSLVCYFLAVSSISSTNTIAKSSKCSVNFTFDGLQAIAMGDPTRFSDGILDVAHHHPQIEISKSVNGVTSKLTVINESQLKNQVLSIRTNQVSQPSKYISTDMARDTSDFRWCLDLESDLFQKALYLKEDKLSTKIHFYAGQFYATNLTENKYQFFADTVKASFTRQIAEPATKVNLQVGDQLTIDGLKDQIKLPYEPGAAYSVAITNLPPKEMASIDHFAYYYDAFKTPVTKFMPVMAQKTAYAPRPLLCGSVVLSKSQL